MSGQYPSATGASNTNHGKMDDDIRTFAEILLAKKDYYTGESSSPPILHDLHTFQI
jgi:hypothetical protein